MNDPAVPDEDGPKAVLVEIEPGFACVFGDVPDGLDLIDAPLIPDRAASKIASAACTGAGIINVAAQAGAHLGAFRGLVQLTPQALEAMKTLTPLAKDGVNYGTLVTAGGQFAAPVTWVPANLAVAGAGVATLGPAVALMVAQIELARITAMVAKNVALTDDLLETLRIERWAEVTGLLEAMQKAIAEARHIGMVSDPIWQNVAGHEALLNKVRTEFAAKVSGHVAAVERARTTQDLSEYLRHHGDAILRDTQALIRAQCAWFTYQAIRAGHLYQRTETDPTAGALLEKMVVDARAIHDRDLAAAATLLRGLNRNFAVMAELPAGRGALLFGKGRRETPDVRHAAQLLRRQLSALGQQIDVEDPPVPVARIVATGGDDPEALLRIVRWHLNPGEHLLAVGAAKGQGWPLKEATYVVVTDERLMVAEKDELLTRGDVDLSLRLGDIRFVRFVAAPESGGKGQARLDVITPDIDIRLSFGPWAADPRHRDKVEQLAHLIGSHMNLPREEIPAAPLPVGSLDAEPLGAATSAPALRADPEDGGMAPGASP